jgi:hypothetical protein
MTANPAAETRFLGDSSALDNTIRILDLISPEKLRARAREDIPSCLAARRACPRFCRARQLQGRRNPDLGHLAYRGARRRRGGAQLPQHLPSSRQQAGAGWRGLSLLKILSRRSMRCGCRRPRCASSLIAPMPRVTALSGRHNRLVNRSWTITKQTNTNPISNAIPSMGALLHPQK